jgi:hypothetical protein
MAAIRTGGSGSSPMAGRWSAASAVQSHESWFTLLLTERLFLYLGTLPQENSSASVPE